MAQVDFRGWIYNGDLTIQPITQEPPFKMFKSRKSPVLWHNRPTTHVTSLYPELLSMIFSYLDVEGRGRAAQVCHSWKSAAYRKSVWKNVQAKIHLEKSNRIVFQSLVMRGITKVQVLSLQKHLKEVTVSVKNLESLVLTGCFNLTNEKLTPAFNRQLLCLTHLDLSMCKKINDDCVGKIVENVPNLTNLNLAGCSTISNGALSHIEKFLKNLRKLNLRSCRNITDSGIARLSGQVPDDHIDRIPSDQIDKQGLKSLECLSIQDCQKLTDDSLKFISSGLRNLRSINLSFCSSITEFGLKNLSTMDSLRDLNLRSCEAVTDLGLRYLSEGGLLALHVLDLSFCDRVRDDGIASIARGFPQLRSLSLNSVPLTDIGLLKMSKTVTDLNTLHLGQCLNITDRGIEAIINNCPQLTTLDIYGINNISHSMIRRLEQNLNLTRDLWQVAEESKIKSVPQFTFVNPN